MLDPAEDVPNVHGQYARAMSMSHLARRMRGDTTDELAGAGLGLANWGDSSKKRTLTASLPGGQLHLSGEK